MTSIIASLGLAGAIAHAATPDAVPQDRTARLAKLAAMPAGNPALGKPIFDKVCSTCHKFGATGATIGPDLTTIAAKYKRPELIESMLFPSKVIVDQYKPELIQTKDGDIISGLIVKENARAVTLVTTEHPEKPIDVLKSQIQARRKSTTSTMPDGLLDTYSDEQVNGLVAYLLRVSK